MIREGRVILMGGTKEIYFKVPLEKTRILERMLLQRFVPVSMHRHSGECVRIFRVTEYSSDMEDIWQIVFWPQDEQELLAFMQERLDDGTIEDAFRLVVTGKGLVAKPIGEVSVRYSSVLDLFYDPTVRKEQR